MSCRRRHQAAKVLSQARILPWQACGLTPQGEGRWLVHFVADADPTDALVHTAAAGDWGLYELTRPRLSLEDVFLELAGDVPANTAEHAA